MKDRQVKAGFTLIELLVVVSIIALLVGILIPSLSSAKEAARSVSCKSNQRSLSLAVHMYMDESDGSYPAAWVIDNPISVAWCGGYYKTDGVKYMDVTMGPLWPYLQEKKIARCSSFTPSKVKYTGSGEISGFGINAQYVAGDPGPPYDMTIWAKPARSTDIKRPAETVIFADCAKPENTPNIHNEEIFIYHENPYDGAWGTTYGRTTHFRHQDRANAAFCDGHVDSIDPPEPLGDDKCGWVAEDLMDRE